jgi:hypothetical protein
MPAFTLDEYGSLVEDLLGSGFTSRAVEDLPLLSRERTLFLRHDVDVHITGIERIGAIEAGLGAVGTYYVPLTLPFNPRYPANTAILRELIAMGHRIGLHYDLASYPEDPSEARAQLDREASMLGEITGVMPATICMHNPSLRGEDLFREVDGYVHPHDPRHSEALLYVSDSCRLWRDETLLRCFEPEPPERLLLNTHPELWLAQARQSREEFLHGTLLENTLAQQRDYVLGEIQTAWSARAGAELRGS